MHDNYQEALSGAAAGLIYQPMSMRVIAPLYCPWYMAWIGVGSQWLSSGSEEARSRHALPRGRKGLGRCREVPRERGNFQRCHGKEESTIRPSLTT